MLVKIVAPRAVLAVAEPPNPNQYSQLVRTSGVNQWEWSDKQIAASTQLRNQTEYRNKAPPEPQEEQSSLDAFSSVQHFRAQR